MARFFPALDQAEFRSEGEYTLLQALAALDDEFTVIHSLPWLRGRTKRVYSPELQEYLSVSQARNHLSGEIDFVILHADLGMLCVETKSGLYRPSGVRFVHERQGYEIDPLSQVRDNTFVLHKMLKSWQMKCPVGYAVHFPDFDLDSNQIASAYVPLDRPLSDGILILHKHSRDIPLRIKQLMMHWKSALNYGSNDNFKLEIEHFLETVWPREVRDGALGRKIVADGELWLRLDDRQANQVALCVGSRSRLIAGFSGSGKTLIARSLAEQFAELNLKVIFLLKNRQITQKVSAQLSHLGRAIVVQTFHSYCESLNTIKREIAVGEPNYDDHHKALHGMVDRQYDVLIVDEAQALNEADHLALREHFSKARRFVFADELQVLPGIERGSTYKFLEETYGERFFYLSTVYRNPGGITQTMLEMRQPRHEVNCPRPVTGEDLGRKISRDVSKTLRFMMASLVKDGVSKHDVIVLGQYSLSLAGIDLPSSTISAYRGMEAPVVIVVAGFDMDDTTLACALGRATTRAHIIVPIELLVGVRGVKSDFLRKLLDKMDRVPIIEQDALEAEPRFIVNRVHRYAGLVGRHEVFGEGFAYASKWRRWVYEGGIRWSNRGVQLWGWMISLTTGTRIVGIDPVRNELTEGWLRLCNECETMTPHDKFDRCLTCVSSPLDDESISQIALQAAVLGTDRSTARGSSMFNAAALIRDFQFPSENEYLHAIDELPDLFIATAVIEYRMRRNASVATKVEVVQWLSEIFVLSELECSYEALAGRAIGSLCAKKLMSKVDTGRYRLTDS
ncbi:AAA family ATPase [Pseudomonas sp. PA-3-10C]|uniref:nuclease-related domain-containing DEAD/DEAH box helicase n=3 Tax=Pseudomonas TaxID=286 RepID=UPI00190BDC5D|nr:MULTISPECIES: AAA family ATPase [unclassified Pseudomonas]MBK3434400.1 AAA family ATPase [Pseudomonas fluorescens]MBK3480312.1 AAA family ATPase [Pseudomonas fluorescens]MCF5508296.1 AAA family ATPase [Pseudomonas sp. PA-3-6H]MCF5517408.1 AAA family ATPase [Pseudomonas sp. PA-3-6E]MCF5563613.1 AAA family ATPase [Pseudomonas sp. PA-3-5D]